MIRSIERTSIEVLSIQHRMRRLRDPLSGFGFVAFVSLVILAFASSAIGAVEDWDMRISGNTKTRSSYIRSLTEKCLEYQGVQKLEDVDPARLQECLINSRLFSGVKVEIKEKQLKINVKDRWSIIPIPFVSGSKGQDTKYGIYLQESNLCGYGKKLGVGGTYSASESSYWFIYNDRSLFLTDWTLGGAFGQSRNQLYHYDGEDEIDGMDESKRFFSLSWGYRFLPNLDASLQYQAIDREYKECEDYQTPQDYQSHDVGLRFRWDDSNFRFYFQEGAVVNVTFMRQISRSDDVDITNAVTMNLKIGWQKEIIDNQVLQIRFNAGRLYGGDRREALRMGGSVGFRGIQDQGAWTEKHLTGSIDYQIPLHMTSTGTWTVAPFVDVGTLELMESEEDQVNYCSYGIETFYFLKKITIPGLGLALGHNNKYQDFFFRFTVGFSL